MSESTLTQENFFTMLEKVTEEQPVNGDNKKHRSKNKLIQVPVEYDGADVSVYGPSVMVSFHFGMEVPVAQAMPLAEKLRKRLHRIHNEYSDKLIDELKALEATL